MKLSQRIVLLAFSGFAACSAPPLEPTIDPQTGTATAQVAADGLLQRVQLTPGAPHTGDTLFVRSTIVNIGVARTVAVRVCNLDLSGMDLRSYQNQCGSFSMSQSLASNDSVSTTDSRIVAAGSGEYKLRIRHLLDPERWLELKVRVSAR
jgi:hypothetical protein